MDKAMHQAGTGQLTSTRATQTTTPQNATPDQPLKHPERTA